MINLKEYPNLIIINDFPPANTQAGPLFMYNLLKNYPSSKLHVICGSHYYAKVNKSLLLSCTYDSFLTTNRTGRFFLGRLKLLMEVLLSPVFFVWTLAKIKKYDGAALVTVTHGYACVWSAVISKFTNLPLITLVHDDWVEMSWKGSFIPHKGIYNKLLYFVLKTSKLVFSVSESMASRIKTIFNINTILQLPATELNQDTYHSPILLEKKTVYKVLYMGSLYSLMKDSILLVCDAVAIRNKTSSTPDYIVEIYSNSNLETRSTLNQKYSGCNISFKDFVKKELFLATLNSADILLIPHSFDKDLEVLTETSFPSKLPECLNSGKPLLVVAPSHSSISKYALKFKFAKVVNNFDPLQVLQALDDITNNPQEVANMLNNARTVLKKNHCLESQRKDFHSQLQKLFPEG